MASPLLAHRRMLARLLLAGALASSAGAACAQGLRPAGYGDAIGYGFADEVVSGAYIGAPLTRLPSPNAIVPAPWSYGTYGIPTLSGLRPAPVAAPRLTVIESGGRAVPARRAGGPRILSRDGLGGWSPAEVTPADSNGVQVVSVRASRR